MQSIIDQSINRNIGTVVLQKRAPSKGSCVWEEVFTQGEIPASKAKKLLNLMKAYRQLMKIYEVDAYRACATSAMPDAANGKEVIETITRSQVSDRYNGGSPLVYDEIHIEYLA